MPLWKPNDRDDLKLWLKSENITGGTTWKDESGLLNHATGDNPPSKTNKGLKNTALFDGTNDTMSTEDTESGPMDFGSGNYYIGVFAKMNVAGISSGAKVLISHDTSTSDCEIRVNHQRKLNFQTNQNTLTSDALVLDQYYLMGARKITSSNTVKLFADDVDLVTQTGDTTTHTDNEVNIGSRNGGSPFWSSEIGEMIVYHSDIGATDIERVSGYVAHKFDNESNLQSGHSYKAGPPTSCHCVSEKTLSTTALSSNPRSPVELNQNLNIYDRR